MTFIVVLRVANMEVGTIACVVPTASIPGGDMSLPSYIVPSLLYVIAVSV